MRGRIFFQFFFTLTYMAQNDQCDEVDILQSTRFGKTRRYINLVHWSTLIFVYGCVLLYSHDKDILQSARFGKTMCYINLVHWSTLIFVYGCVLL